MLIQTKKKNRKVREVGEIYLNEGSILNILYNKKNQCNAEFVYEESQVKLVMKYITDYELFVVTELSS